MESGRAALLVFLAVLAAFNAAAQRETPPLAEQEQSELQKFIAKFPGISATLGPDPCQWCGCMTLFCRANDEGNASFVNSISIYRRDAPGNGESGLGDGGCRPYTDCPLDAFDVILEEGDWPELLQLAELRIANYSGAGSERIKGQLPEQLPQLLPSLTSLQLVGTGLGGTVPAIWFEAGEWELLSQLDIRQNAALKGQLPDIPAGALPSISSLTINDAPLGGTVPSISAFPLTTETSETADGVSGITIDFANLGLTGTLPARFAGGAVYELRLENNNLEGTLPPEWGEPGHFGGALSINLANNSLTGTIPASWGTGILTTTEDNGQQRLYFQGNNLTGPIPSSFGTSGRYFPNELFINPGNSFCGQPPNNTVLLIAVGDSDFNTDVNATLPACTGQAT